MRKLKLTKDNLINLGLTPEILYSDSDFADWREQNKDIIVDFKNEMIYCDIIELQNSLNSFFELTISELRENGMTDDDIKIFIDNKTIETRHKFNQFINKLSDEDKFDFLLQALSSSSNQFSVLKKQYFEAKVDELLSSNRINTKANNSNELDFKENFDNNKKTPYSNTTEFLTDNKILLHEKIKHIINHPASVLMRIDDDFKGYDEEGNELFSENIENIIYDYEAEIKTPFQQIELLTMEIMENKTQAVIDGYLTIIFQDLMEIMPIVVDYCNDTVFKQNNYPINRYEFFFQYHRALGKYYDFLVVFLNKEIFSKYNNIISDGFSYISINKDGENQVTIVNDSNDKIVVENKNKANTEDENNYLMTSIEEYLESIQDFIDTQNYGVLIDALYTYFTTSKFPELNKKIVFKRVNKKKVGWALKEVYKNTKQDTLDIEYFRFAQQNINLFEKEIIVDDNFNKSKFYKLFTTNPDK